MEPLYMYIYNRLSLLPDDQLRSIDFQAAIKKLETFEISSSDHKHLTDLFLAINNYFNNGAELAHYGILGMKWGVRRFQNPDGSLTPAGEERYRKARALESLFGSAKAYSIATRQGEMLQIKPLKQTALKKIATAIMGPSMGERGDANYIIESASGKDIGQLSLINKNPDTAYIDWIYIADAYRGRGYATDIIRDLLDRAKDSGYTKVELNALKEARPLYERIGFEYAKDLALLDKIVGFELGAKRMVYDLKKNHHADELMHHGIKGQRWGVRRYQNEDGSLTEAGQKRYLRDYERDAKWAQKRQAKIQAKAYKKIKKELSQYETELVKAEAKKQGINLNASKEVYFSVPKSVINAYNKKAAELLSEQVKDLKTPHGHSISFVAKRGDIGVLMLVSNNKAVADYLKNGVWDDGRIAYKKEKLEWAKR